MPSAPTRVSPRRFAFTLIGVYFFVVSTPLANVLYPRMAGMPMLGLMVLAGGASLPSSSWPPDEIA